MWWYKSQPHSLGLGLRIGLLLKSGLHILGVTIGLYWGYLWVMLGLYWGYVGATIHGQRVWFAYVRGLLSSCAGFSQSALQKPTEVSARIISRQWDA